MKNNVIRVNFKRKQTIERHKFSFSEFWDRWGRDILVLTGIIIFSWWAAGVIVHLLRIITGK